MFPFLNRPFTLDRAVRTALWLLIVAGCGMAVAGMWEVLLPFLLAGLFAYVMMPLVRGLQRVRLFRSRGVAVLIVFLGLGLLLTIAMLYLIPAVEAEVDKTLEALAQYSGEDTLIEMLIPASLLEMMREAIDLKTLSSSLSPDKVIETSKALWTQAEGIVSGTLSVFSWSLVFAMGIIYFIFIMLDFEGLGKGLMSLFPEGARPTLRTILGDLDYYMNSYFRGQALIALSVGVLLTIGFNLIGLPMATALGIFIGLLNFIPYMQALGLFPLALLAALMSAQTGQNLWVCELLAFGVLMAVQVIQDTLLVPRIMGSSMGMRPSLILLALAIWGYLLGFFGMLVALPLTMAIYSTYMRYVLCDRGYIQTLDAKILGRVAKRRGTPHTPQESDPHTPQTSEPR